MKPMLPKVFLCALLLLVASLDAQVVLSPSPARALGHAELPLVTTNPNLVEGRELYLPQSIAVDTTSNPPTLYVADTFNNRVLGWRDALNFATGAFADVVIGQSGTKPEIFYKTFPQGPGTIDNKSGLSYPTAVAVDSTGNLFVADSGNNRILRYSKSVLASADATKLPDFVIGQKNLSSNAPNAGGISEKTLFLYSSGALFTTSLTLDALGNLFIADAGNSRVLRYPASSIGVGATNGPGADLVLGQASFTASPAVFPSSLTDLTHLVNPSGVGFDSAGRLFVTDSGHRVLVYAPPLNSGMAAQKYIGAVLDASNHPFASDKSLNLPNGVFFEGIVPYVVDTGNNRILRFPPFDNWPFNGPPVANAVIGQDDFNSSKPNKGSSQPDGQLMTLNQPTAAVVALGQFFVADAFNNRVAIGPDPSGLSYGLTRVAGQALPDAASPNLIEGREFYFGPGGALAIDRSSDPPHLYVADSLNNRVLCFLDARTVKPGVRADIVIGQKRFDNFARAIANYPSGDPNQPSNIGLLQPDGVAVDSTGNLYVADTGNGRVVRFRSPFRQAQPYEPVADLVLGKPDFTTSVLNAPDPSPSNMGSPFGLAFTSDGSLLVSDVAYNRVLYFLKPAGGDFSIGMSAAKVIGQADFFSRGSGSTLDRMKGPNYIATDSKDRLYVCDRGNSRILVFNTVTDIGPDPQAPLALTAGTKDYYGGLKGPQGIYVNQDSDEIWVANTSAAPGQGPYYDSGQKFVFHYPKFEDLILNPYADFTVPFSNFELPLALTLDTFGNLLVSTSANRVVMFFPAVRVQNAANYMPGIAPGMIASLFAMGGSFGTQVVEAPDLPLPTELADVQVLVNDIPAPLFFVSPKQINFQVSKDIPPSRAVNVVVVRKSVGQVLAVGCPVQWIKRVGDTDQFECLVDPQTRQPYVIAMGVASPALFAGPGYSSATGSIAALNRKTSDGSYYGINSPQNPVARGDFVEMFGTGQGQVPHPPLDGVKPGAVFPTAEKPQVLVNTAFVDPGDVLFSGLSPDFPGVWQIDVKIPMSVPPADAIQVVLLYKAIASNYNHQPHPLKPDLVINTTISVKQ